MKITKHLRVHGRTGGIFLRDDQKSLRMSFAMFLHLFLAQTLFSVCDEQSIDHLNGVIPSDLLIPSAIRLESCVTQNNRSGDRASQSHHLPLLLWLGDQSAIPSELIVTCDDLSAWERGPDQKPIWLLRHDGKIAYRDEPNPDSLVFYCLNSGRQLKIDCGRSYTLHQVSDRYTLVAFNYSRLENYYREDDPPGDQIDLSSIFLSPWSSDHRATKPHNPAYLVDLDGMQSAQIDLSTWAPSGTLVAPGSDRLLFFGPMEHYAIVDIAENRVVVGPVRGYPSSNLLGNSHISVSNDGDSRSVWNIADRRVVYQLDENDIVASNPLSDGIVFAKSGTSSLLLVPPHAPPDQGAPADPVRPKVVWLSGLDHVSQIGNSPLLQAVPPGSADGRFGVIAGTQDLDVIIPPLFSDSLEAETNSNGRTFAWARSPDGDGFLAFHEDDPATISVFANLIVPNILSAWQHSQRSINRYAIAAKFAPVYYTHYEFEIIDTRDLDVISAFGKIPIVNTIEWREVWPGPNNEPRYRLFAGIMPATKMECRSELLLVR